VAPVTGYNVYAGNRSGSLRYAGAASGTSFTLTALPGSGAVAPPAQNTSGVPVVANDVVMSATGSVWSGTLPKTAIINAQTGLPYVLIRRNGITIAGPDLPATQDTVAISADGTTFSANDASGATAWYDVWTLYKPNPA
jgi:sugar lactone lactonase YvrE